MHLIFFIPSLYKPLKTWQRDFGFQAQSTCLAQLQTHIKSLSVNHSEVTQYFCGQSLSMTSPAQVRTQAYDSAVIICADPIHIETSMQGVSVRSQSLEVTSQEAESIIKELNHFLVQDDLRIEVDVNLPQHWYLLGDGLKSLISTPLTQIEEGGLLSALPQGEHKAYWHRLWSEVQMLLHSHPVNQAREQQGKPSINALWFWGEAAQALNQYAEHPIDTVVNGGVVEQAIAQSCECDYVRAEHFKDITWGEDKRYLVVLDQLQLPAQQDDCESWQVAFSQLERDWLKPAMECLDQGKCELSLIFDEAQLHQALPYKPSWLFWKKRPFNSTVLDLP